MVRCRPRVAHSTTAAGVAPSIPCWVCSVTCRANGDSQVTFVSSPGATVTIEVSSDLVAWDTLATLANPDGVCQFADPSARNFDRSFYRVVVEP